MDSRLDLVGEEELNLYRIGISELIYSLGICLGMGWMSLCLILEKGLIVGSLVKDFFVVEMGYRALALEEKGLQDLRSLNC
jgi:hypothetical protein